MKKILINELIDNDFSMLLTIIDPNILLSYYLKKIKIKQKINRNSLVLVDLALKTGTDKDRFVSFFVDKKGKINFSSHVFLYPNQQIIKQANRILVKTTVFSNTIFINTEKKLFLKANI